MLTELLEKFEDIFQPASKEEQASRIPKDAVVLTIDIYWNSGLNEFGPLSNSFNSFIAPAGTIMIPNQDGLGYDYVNLKETVWANLKPEWYKPYHKATNESFEDIFQPHSPEEVEKRWPTHTIRFTKWSKAFGGGAGGAAVKVMKIKFPDVLVDVLFGHVLKKIGLPEEYINYDMGKGYHVEIKKSDAIVDDEGKLMDGKYVLTKDWRSRNG